MDNRSAKVLPKKDPVSVRPSNPFTGLPGQPPPEHLHLDIQFDSEGNIVNPIKVTEDQKLIAQNHRDRMREWARCRLAGEKFSGGGRVYVEAFSEKDYWDAVRDLAKGD